MCVEDGKVCMHDMMMQDEMGGGGLDGIGNVEAYSYDRHRAIDGHGHPLGLPDPEPGPTPEAGSAVEKHEEACLTNANNECGPAVDTEAAHDVH